MKIVTRKIGLILRLGMTAVVLLLGQQAMAVGTDAGTLIANTVNVDYEVNSVNQDDLTDTVSFLVDRRVDFTLTQLGSALVNVTPGEPTAYFFDLLLTNTSNSTLDFSLVLDDAIATVRSQATTASMSNIEYAVNTLVYTTSEADPVQGGPQFVDELAEDDAIRIRVWGDAALSLLNGQIDGIAIEATAGETGTGGEGPALSYAGPNGDLTIENVAANASGGGVEIQSDGFLVVTADLTVTKSYAVIAGDFGTGMPIPGATVEYTILVVNGSATAADDVVITDTIDGNVTLDLNVAAYAGEDIFLDNNGTPQACNVESNVDGDGCDGPGPGLTIGSADLVGGITVAGGETLTIQYRVTIL